MRGYKLLPQPYCTPGYSFCWNGECYAHDHPAAANILVSPPFDVAEDKYEEVTSDTVTVMELMIQHELLSVKPTHVINPCFKEYRKATIKQE
jgi:hypothetical protein